MRARLRLNQVDPDLEPQIASDFGRELFRYVVAARSGSGFGF